MAEKVNSNMDVMYDPQWKKWVLVAMARQEGFGEVGNRPTRNNNPLDLVWGAEARMFGALRGDTVKPHGFMGMGGMAVFPDKTQGWVAAKRWLSVPAKFGHNGELISGYRGATLRQIIFRFAPPTDNNSMQYLGSVCQLTGLHPDDTIGTNDLLTPWLGEE